MNWRELSHPPNLISLGRILLAPIIGYLLWRPEAYAMWISLGLVVAAAITDALDGYLARRMNLVTALGIALDPIADKVFATILVVGLILFRDFPLWLATLVIGRDLLLLLGGALLLRGRRGLTLPSNLTGKWAFAALAVLLGAHIIRFDFSIALMTPIVVLLMTASLFVYGRVFVRLLGGQTVAPYQDRSFYRLLRIGICSLVAVAHFWAFWRDFLA